MRASRTPGISDRANHISLTDTLSTAYVDRAQMRVQGLEVVAVVYHDHIPIPVIVPARIDDHACIGRIYGFPVITGNVDPPVVGVGTIVKPGKEMIVRRPDECAKPHCTS